MTALRVTLAAACAIVLAETALFFRNLTGLRSLSRIVAPDPPAWPRVSVIMAARDEAQDVGAAVASRLADDYPDLEVILVDDRSVDGTGTLAAEAAGGDPRFTLVRIDHLPEGWLGKVHALDAGVRHASGEWYLFSDGDVSVAPGTVRRAVAYSIAEGLGMLALVPTYDSGSVIVDAVWTIFLRALGVLVDPRKVRDPRSRVAIGSGAFNLVSREAYEHTPGFEHLRMETGDDVALGVMVKAAGARLEMIDGRGCAHLAMYRSVRELLRGVEKNGSTTAALPFPLVVGAFGALTLLLASPAAALVVGPAWLRVLGGSALALYTLAEASALWVNTGRWAPALLWPLGGAIMAYAMLRSTWLAHRRGGVYWRGTFYPLDELAEGRRFRF